MTKEQANSIIEIIDNYLELEIEKIALLNFESENDYVGQFKLKDFIVRTNTLLQQFKVELQSPDHIILPIGFNPPATGIMQIDLIISHLYEYCKNGNFIDAEQQLIWIINYAQQFGFYDRTKYQIYPLEVKNFEKTKSELSIAKHEYENLKNSFLELNAKGDSTLGLLNEFLENIQNEFSRLRTNLEESSETLIKINNFSTESEILKNKINSTLEFIREENNRIKKNSISLEKSQNDLNNNSNEIINVLNTKIKEFEGKNTEFETQLKFVTDKTKYFQERNEILDTLIGREVGASLFETFKQRKRELSPSIKYWGSRVLWMGIITFILIITLFTNFFGLFGDLKANITWETLLSTILKSSPAFFLLYYCISQYNKERNFQEEYAFKSAVALTVNAYADILTNDDNKDQLILEAVYSLYKSPTYIANNNLNKKDVNTMTDLLGKVIDNTTQILTKGK